MDAKRTKINPKYDPVNLTLNGNDYSESYKKSDDDEKLDDLPLECDEEKYYIVPSTPLLKGVKEGKALKILTPNKLLTTLLILLAQIK